MSTAVLELTEATFDPEITDSPLPVVVEFWAQWCPIPGAAAGLDHAGVEAHTAIFTAAADDLVTGPRTPAACTRR